MYVSFQHFRNFGKNMEAKCKPKYILYLFSHTTDSQKHQKPQKNDFPATYQEALHYKIVIDYNKIMKSNDFRHLSDNGSSKEVSLLCFIKIVVLVLFRCWKKKINKNYQKSDIKKTLPRRAYSIQQQWERRSRKIQQTTAGLSVRGVFSCANGDK